MRISTMKKIMFAGLMVCTVFSTTQAQFTNDYTPIKSSGAIPSEFLATARTMSEAEIKGIGYGKDHDAKSQFTIHQNYLLHNLLLNGDVLVNDPLTRYVNK